MQVWFDKVLIHFQTEFSNSPKEATGFDRKCGKCPGGGKLEAITVIINSCDSFL
jgi:hypothetical protein